MTEQTSPRKLARQHALVRPCDDESQAPGLELHDLVSSDPVLMVATTSEMKMASTDNRLTLDFALQDACETMMPKSTEAERRSPDQSGIPSISNLHPSIRVRSSYTEAKSANNSAETSPDRIQKTPSPKELRSSFGFRNGMRKKRDVVQAGWNDVDSERSDCDESTENGSTSEVPSPLRSARKSLTIKTEDLMNDLNDNKHATNAASSECDASLSSGPIDFSVCEMADTKLPYSPFGVKRLKANVNPPKTPSGSSRYDAADAQDALSATQRVRVGLSEYIGNGTPDKSRLVIDKSRGNPGPVSCPPMFHASGKQQFSVARTPKQHGQEVLSSKLLPSRNHVNCLIGYIHELHQSEASLRVHLAKYKQQSDAKLANALARQILLGQELDQSRKIIADQQKRIRELSREASYASGTEEYQLIDPSFEESDSCSSELCDSPPPCLGKMEMLYRKSLLQNERISKSVRHDAIRDQDKWDGRELFHSDAATPAEPTIANLVSELSGSAAQPVMSPMIKPLWKPWSSGGSESDVSLSFRPPMFTIAPSTEDILPQQGSARPGSKSGTHLSPCLKSIISTPGKIFGPSSKDEQLPVFGSSTLQTQVLPTADSKMSNGLPPLVPVKVTSTEQKPACGVNTAPQAATDNEQLDELPLANEAAISNEQIPPERVDEKELVQEKTEKAVTLEHLLLEFYKENDKTKESMAHVYAKRYQGRESWLFTELSKRYSKSKVDALKDRFAECVQHATRDTYSASKVSHRSTYELSSAVKLAVDQDMKSPLDLTEVLAESATSSSPAKRSPQKVSPNSRSMSLHRASTTPVAQALVPSAIYCETLKPTVEEPEQNDDDNLSTSIDSSSAVEKQTCDKNDIVASNCRNIPNSTSAVENSDEHRDSESKVTTSRPPPLQLSSSSLVNSKASPILRQGELSQGTFSPPSGSPVAITKELSSSPRKKSSIRQYPTCSITLEALLMDLYRSHQPNELRNVQHVADEYRGKERDLIIMLKSKYGALSVKRLEENFATLEKLGQDQSCGKNQKRFHALKIGAKIVLAAVVGVISCSIGISLVNSQSCHDRSQNPEAQRGNGSNCVAPANLTFGIDSDATKCSIAPVDSVNEFCAEWMEREASWLTTHSMKDALELLKVLPFSPVIEFPYKSMVYSFNMPFRLGEKAKSVIAIISEAATANLVTANDSSLIHLDDTVYEALTKAALASKLLADTTIALVTKSSGDSTPQLASHDESAAAFFQDEQDIDERKSWLKKSSVGLQCPWPSATTEISSENKIPQQESSEESADGSATTHSSVSLAGEPFCEPVPATFAANANFCTLEQHGQMQEFYAQDPATLLALAEQAALAQLQGSG